MKQWKKRVVGPPHSENNAICQSFYDFISPQIDEQQQLMLKLGYTPLSGSRCDHRERLAVHQSFER